MTHEEEAEYCHMWDGSEDWVLYKLYHELTSLTIHFVDRRPNVQEIIALRKLLPEYRYLPPNEVREIIGESSVLELPPMPKSDASRLAERGQCMKLQVSEKDTSYTDYAPILRTGNPVQLISIIIEEETLSQEIISRMLAADVSIDENFE